jgi:hypothetical protein
LRMLHWLFCSPAIRAEFTVFSLLRRLADPFFPAQFTVKNVICSSDIFHWKKWWKFESFFTPFQLSFRVFHLKPQKWWKCFGFFT